MKKVSYLDISKRNSLLENDEASTRKVYVESIYKNKTKTKSKMNELLLNCSFSPTLSSQYISEMINYFRETGDKEFIKKVDDRIVPLLNAAALYEAMSVDELKESADLMKKCDRIYSNTESINKDNDIESIFENGKGLNDKNLMYKVCESVKGFNVVSRGKVIISLETFCYLAQKHGIEYSDKSILEAALGYYLINEESMNIDKLDAALKKNVVVDYDPNSESRFPCIDVFKLSRIKNKELLESTLNILMANNISMYKEGLGEFFVLLKEILISSEDDDLCDSVYSHIIPSIYDKVKTCFSDKDEYKDYVLATLAVVDFYIDDIQNIHRYQYEETVTNRLIHLADSMTDLAENLESLRDMLYDKNNITMINVSKLSEGNTKVALLSLKKKVFKHENLVTVIKNLDKFLTKKFKAIHNVTKDKLKKVKDKIFALESVQNYIDENGKFDYTISSFVVENSRVTNPLLEDASKLCEIMNNELYGSGLHTYYSATENILEFHLVSEDVYDIEDIEKDESIVDEDEEYVGTIMGVANLIDIENIPNEDQLIEFAQNHPDIESHDTLLELASLCNIDNYTIGLIEIMSYDYREKSADIEHKYSNYKSANSPVDIQAKALKLLSEMVLNEAAGDPSGPNFSNLKLTLMGLKKKLKDLGSKEQAICRTADTSFNIFVRNLNKALISDRREAIIKGSVIPSFSKCIKIGIALIGIGIVSGNPIYPCIVALGGFAASKKLTAKERTLLLDDIAVELEVIEKEIHIAESKDQMKKLRALLKTKKELQRQYQRIKYNARIGKELLPSGTGVNVGGE